MNKTNKKSETTFRIKKPRVFRPFKNPRFLLGSNNKAACKKDLKMFNEFRYRCFTAKKRIDNDPPKMNPHSYITPSRFNDDRQRLIEIARQNRALLKAINLINRTQGRVDSYNPFAYENYSRWSAHLQEAKVIEKRNKEIYKLITTSRSMYSKKMMDNHWKYTVQRMEEMSQFPLVVLKKQPTHDEILKAAPSISDMGKQKPLKRLYAYMEFQIKGSIKLGRIIIELYNDYVPITVQNFLGLCRGENGLSYKQCLIHNVARGKYIETGDITKGNGKGGVSIYGESFDEENFDLKHTRAGTLSMVSVKGKNNSQFCITLSEMEKLNGKRVVFGKIVKGNETIFKIQDVGRRIGKPLEPVFISDCGEFKRDKSKTKKLSK